MVIVVIAVTVQFVYISVSIRFFILWSSTEAENLKRMRKLKLKRDSTKTNFVAVCVYYLVMSVCVWMYRDSDDFRCAVVLLLPSEIHTLYLFCDIFLVHSAVRSSPRRTFGDAWHFVFVSLRLLSSRAIVVDYFSHWKLMHKFTCTHSSTHICQSENAVESTFTFGDFTRTAHMHTQIDFVKTVEHAIEFFVWVHYARCTYRFLHEINLIDKLQNVKLMSDIGIVRCMLCV